MIAQSIEITGYRDLYARLWCRGDGRERGVVILLHGLGDHGGRYLPFAREMIRHNWAVFAADLPGHGRSPGRRGTARSYDSILKMVAAIREQLSTRINNDRHFLVGHSMGGNFAVNYALRCKEFEATDLPDLAGLVLLAPMLRPPEFLDRQKVFAAWGTGQLLRWVRIRKPARVEQLMRDPGAADRFQSDPLQHGHISLYLATQLLAQGRFALDHAAQISIPTLVIHGDEDELIDQAACRNLVLRMRQPADCVSWPGGRHDLINDVDADQVIERLADWMEQHSQTAASLAAA